MRPPFCYFGGKQAMAAVVLSGYPSALYDELYGDWCILDVPVTVNTGNAHKGERRTPRVERIWSNRDLNAGRLALSTNGHA